MAYLSAWHEDVQSELIIRRLAAQLRRGAMLEARDRLECRARAFRDMLRLMTEKQLVQVLAASITRLVRPIIA